MSKLFNYGMNETTTEKGMSSFKSTLNKNLDLFFKIGASRGLDLSDDFMAAYDEDSNLATRILLWSRDVRGGAGERQIFRDLITKFPLTDKFIEKIPEIGRWDDLLVLLGTKYQEKVISIIESTLKEGNGLCAKWMPRKGKEAIILRNGMGLTPKRYRKLLVGLTNVVETKMCSNKWNEIEYGKVPSLATARYSKAFTRHDPDRYEEYIENLSTGDEKINVGAIYPYDVVKTAFFGNSNLANEQWKKLPDYVPQGKSFLPVCDVSGSMMCSIGNNKNLTPLLICISLGIYLAERNKGIFKDKFITFSTDPEMIQLEGDNLTYRARYLENSNWGGSTNLEKTFELILRIAKKYNLVQEDLPEVLLIMSDMQFDCAVHETNDNAFEMIHRMYKESGFVPPQLVFWNLADRGGNIPITFDTNGVALVSGFSPQIMTNLLGGELNPVKIMEKTVCINRYDF